MSAVEQALDGSEIEVAAKATRRRFTLDYKRKIVREADRCKTPGAVGALLRREGLYSSHLTAWRAARERGELPATTVKQRGPAPRVRDPRDKRIAELERENAFWRKRAERAEAPGRGSKKHRGVAGDATGHRALLMATVTEVGPPARHRSDVRGARGAPGD